LGPIKLFLDANVIFAAAATPQGRAQALFALAAAGHCELWTSAYALEEARRNLRRKYPDTLSRLNALTAQLTIAPEADLSLLTWAQEQLPSKDAPILAAAVGCRAAVLITGDTRHFGLLYGRVLRGVAVLGLRQALEWVLAS
jgi:predicted nucleic acid-binding protein